MGITILTPSWLSSRNRAWVRSCQGKAGWLAALPCFVYTLLCAQKARAEHREFHMAQFPSAPGSLHVSFPRRVCSLGCALCQGGDYLCPLEAVLTGMRYLGMFWLQAAAGVRLHDSQNSIPSGNTCPWVCTDATGGLESTLVPPSQHHPIACSS